MILTKQQRPRFCLWFLRWFGRFWFRGGSFLTMNVASPLLWPWIMRGFRSSHRNHSSCQAWPLSTLLQCQCTWALSQFQFRDLLPLLFRAVGCGCGVNFLCLGVTDVEMLWKSDFHGENPHHISQSGQIMPQLEPRANWHRASAVSGTRCTAVQSSLHSCTHFTLIL